MLFCLHKDKNPRSRFMRERTSLEEHVRYSSVDGVVLILAMVVFCILIRTLGVFRDRQSDEGASWSP